MTLSETKTGPHPSDQKVGSSSLSGGTYTFSEPSAFGATEVWPTAGSSFGAAPMSHGHSIGQVVQPAPE